MALEHWDALPINTVRPEQGHQHGEPLPMPLPKGLVQSPAARNSEQQPVKALPSAAESPYMMQSVSVYRKKEMPVILPWLSSASTLASALLSQQTLYMLVLGTQKISMLTAQPPVSVFLSQEPVDLPSEGKAVCPEAEFSRQTLPWALGRGVGLVSSAWLQSYSLASKDGHENLSGCICRIYGSSSHHEAILVIPL